MVITFSWILSIVGNPFSVSPALETDSPEHHMWGGGGWGGTIRSHLCHRQSLQQGHSHHSLLSAQISVTLSPTRGPHPLPPSSQRGQRPLPSDETRRDERAPATKPFHTRPQYVQRSPQATGEPALEWHLPVARKQGNTSTYSALCNSRSD